jgi:RNA polymerase sigma-70 factor (ECF subfamily)
MWPDAWLINAIRRDPPDEEALDTLVERYWKMLYAHCHMITQDPDSASDLAQEAWLRLLKARRLIESDGNFQGYVITIATNLWRDMHRAALRAGSLAERRVAPLDCVEAEEGKSVWLGNVVADPRTVPADDQLLLEMDLDRALARLEPRLRDVLVSRFIKGESASEIGGRYSRTEQSITAWIREAILQMKGHLCAQ